MVAFFQFRAGVFTPQNTPALNGVVEKLQAELISLDTRELSNFWGIMGSKYLPSVIYKVKTLPIRHVVPEPDIPVIKKI